jgi:hypothetical protein
VVAAAPYDPDPHRTRPPYAPITRGPNGFDLDGLLGARSHARRYLGVLPRWVSTDQGLALDERLEAKPGEAVAAVQRVDRGDAALDDGEGQHRDR